MRTLTSVQSATFVTAILSVKIKATDASTTWDFPHSDLVDLSGLSWEIPFGGGLGRTSTYQLTISTSDQFVKTNLKNLIKSTVNLRVDVNQDNFFPHVGRVREVERFAEDPNLLRLTIFDKLFDEDPKFPVSSITDSYSVVHPDISAVDMGHPEYFGLHHRPFYHTPVDCNIASLLTPKNVTSANLVNSVWFNARMERGTDTTRVHTILMNKTINANSGLITGGHGFELKEIGANDVRIYQVENFKNQNGSYAATIAPWSMGEILSAYNGTTLLRCEVTSYFNNSARFEGAYIITKRIPQDVSCMTLYRFSCVTSNVTNIASSQIQASLGIDSGQGELIGSLQTSNSHSIVGVFSTGLVSSNQFFVSNARYNIRFTLTSSYNGLSTMTTCCDFNVLLPSDQYKNYSIFSNPVSSADIALSTNPIRILGDIFDKTGLPFVTAQSSSAQINVQSYAFNCGFYERQSVTQIADEFGQITATYMWIADSGMMNFRTYQQSGNATVNATITTSDFFRLSIRDNPLGTSKYNVVKASKIKINYGYNFTTKNYENILQADQSNNSLCDSMDASGIKKDLSFDSKYILATDTASYWLGNRTRLHAQGEQIIEADLPARFFGLELTDVVKVQHPIFQNSESLYQITQIVPDYLKGTVKITAEELLSLSA